MSSDEVTEMVLEIINEGVEVGEKALKNALATIKIKTGQSSLPDLIEETSPAVVRIAIRGTMETQQNPFFDDPFFERFFGQPQMPREREFGGGGSGVIIDGQLGYIITNAHVIDRADEIKVFSKDGEEYDAEVLGSDKGTDLALIKITSDKKLPEIKLGDAFVCNDAYLAGGTHLPDISIITPIFYDREIKFFAACLGHHSDVGGAVPGSILSLIHI